MADEVTIRERFEAAYVRGWTPVFRFALAWTNDREEAMDAAQETFTRIWERREHLDFAADIVPLALTIERRLLTDRWRSLRRRVKLPVHLESRQVAWTAAATDDWLDVQAAFSSLTPTERVALTAVSVSGFTYAEVAAVLGTTEGALRAAASRGRRKLAEER